MWFSFLLLVVGAYGQDGARVVISPEANPIQKPAGEQVSLLCSVEQSESDMPGLMWTKHGGLHRTANVKVVKLDSNTLSMTISNASSENSGVYTCQAQLNETLLQKTIDVVIFEDYHFVDKSATTGAVMATAAINISCEVYPQRNTLRTVWSRTGQTEWAPGARHRMYKGGSILEISTYDPLTDAGEYTCKVSNSATGAALYKKIRVGSEQENKNIFCTNMCTNVCSKMWTAP